MTIFVVIPMVLIVIVVIGLVFSVSSGRVLLPWEKGKATITSVQADDKQPRLNSTLRVNVRVDEAPRPNRALWLVAELQLSDHVEFFAKERIPSKVDQYSYCMQIGGKQAAPIGSIRTFEVVNASPAESARLQVAHDADIRHASGSNLLLELDSPVISNRVSAEVTRAGRPPCR